MISETVVSTVAVMTGLACLGTVASLLGRHGWCFELACHFRLQYLLIGLLGTIVFVLERRLPEAGLAAGVVLVNLRNIVPRSAKRPERVDRPTLRIFLANIYRVNRSYDAVRRVIRQVDPDVLVLLEVDQDWLAALKDLCATHPYSKWALLSEGFGIACFSRVPADGLEAGAIGGVSLPSVIARLRVEGQPLTLIGTHPLAPGTPRRVRSRNAQLDAIAEFVSKQTVPVMVIGDLNVTSWSPVFHDFLLKSRLRDSREWFGVQPSWPVWLPPFLRIPIDHGLVSSAITVHARQLGPRIGSDHLPVIIDCSLG